VGLKLNLGWLEDAHRGKWQRRCVGTAGDHNSKDRQSWSSCTYFSWPQSL